MKTLAIIQARMGSTRLPGKALQLIEDHPMLWYVIERTKKAKNISDIVVATTVNPEDGVIEEFCKENGIKCYRGDENDVLDRFYNAAKYLKAERLVRITADCPLIDPEIIDNIIQEFESNHSDYASNTVRYSYPEGLDAEVFSFKALEKAWKEAKSRTEREHVTPYIRLSGKFKVHSVESAKDYSNDEHHWSVDKEEDLNFVREVYKSFKGKKTFGYKDVLHLLETKPTIKFINKNQITNEGYYRTVFQEAKSGAAPKLKVQESLRCFERSSKTIPGASQTFSKSSLQYVYGVSPLFLKKGKGCKVWDVDGNEYIDYVQGLLPNILGYANEEVNKAFYDQACEGHSFSLAHPVEFELAEKLVEIIPCAEMVRFAKNGSDATAGAIRAARAYTKRDFVATCGYHGWQDWCIGTTTRNAGVPQSVRDLTHPFPYNDLQALENLLSKNKYAAVILEPFNFTEPKPGYLESVKELTKKNGALLIFDEICTGFMFGLGGAQKLFNVTPDMACFGKALGNGYAISAVVGKKEFMKVFEEIFFSFTSGGEVASMKAALKVIEILETTDALKNIEATGRKLKDGFNTLSKEAGLFPRLECIGRPQWTALKFRDQNMQDSMLVRSLFSQEIVKRGILLLVSHNLTSKHDENTTDKTLRAYSEVIKTLKKWLSESNPEKYLEGKMIQPVFKVR